MVINTTGESEDDRSGVSSVSRKGGTSVDPHETLSVVCLALFVRLCSLAVSDSSRRSSRRAGSRLPSLWGLMSFALSSTAVSSS